MSEQEILELAAILVNEHGYSARDAAERRRNQHASHSESFRLWTRISHAVAQLLETVEAEKV